MIDITKLIAEVRRLAAQYPDYIYWKPTGLRYCSYVSGKVENLSGDICPNQGCIFGQALRNLYPDFDFTEIEQKKGIGEFLDEQGLPPHEPDHIWCVDVQCNQDFGMTWRKSVNEADEIRFFS